jgi:hypothetical protein
MLSGDEKSIVWTSVSSLQYLFFSRANQALQACHNYAPGQLSA